MGYDVRTQDKAGDSGVGAGGMTFDFFGPSEDRSVPKTGQSLVSQSLEADDGPNESEGYSIPHELEQLPSINNIRLCDIISAAKLFCRDK